MINKALQFVKEILDQFLRNRYGLQESMVLVNRIIDNTGAVPSANANKVVISLINIEKETLKQFYGRNQKMTDGNYADIHPSERYNLYLLISANYDDYNETLKFLNASIRFFQVHPAVTAESYSNIPKGIDKLEFEIEKITYHQMHSLWTAMGAHYQPSLIYKLRLISVQGEEADGFTKSVSNVSSTASV